MQSFANTLKQYRKLYYTTLASISILALFFALSILAFTAPLGFYKEWQFVYIMRSSAIVFTFVGAMASNFAFERSMRSCKNMVHLSQRIKVFTEAYSMKLFICGFGALGCCLTFIFSGDWFQLIGAAICLAIVGWANPTKENIALWLYMPQTMQTEFYDKLNIK